MSPEEIDAAVNVPAGVSAWIYAQQDTTVFLTGTPTAGTLPALTGGSQFLGNALAEPLDLTALLPSLEPAALAALAEHEAAHRARDDVLQAIATLQGYESTV